MSNDCNFNIDNIRDMDFIRRHTCALLEDTEGFLVNFGAYLNKRVLHSDETASMFCRQSNNYFSMKEIMAQMDLWKGDCINLWDLSWDLCSYGKCSARTNNYDEFIHGKDVTGMLKQCDRYLKKNIRYIKPERFM